MSITPATSIHGDTIRFHRDLYTALRRFGFSHPEIKAMSVRQALLHHFGSPEAVDANMGEGTYSGVKQRLGGLGSWRKQWKRATAEHVDEYLAQCAALEHMRESARRCQQLGVMDQGDVGLQTTSSHPPTRSHWRTEMNEAPQPSTYGQIKDYRATAKTDPLATELLTP